MMKSIFFFNQVAVALALLFSTSFLAAKDFQRVLFLGNSITKHGPKESIGWAGNWGMAASAAEKDYVHLVSSELSESAKTMVRNIAAFEREHASYNLDSLHKEVREFAPDLIILAIGENVPKLSTPESEKVFAEAVRKLLNGMKNDEGPAIVVRSSFWANEPKDRILRQVCGEFGGTFVDIGHLGKEESNYARAERDFSHKGVAAHPGDKGMQAIAEAILQGVKKEQLKRNE